MGHVYCSKAVMSQAPRVSPRHSGLETMRSSDPRGLRLRAEARQQVGRRVPGLSERPAFQSLG